MKVIHYAVCSPTNAFFFFFFFFFKTNSRQLWASQPEKITGFRLLTRTLYQVSHYIRVKKTKRYKELGPAKLPHKRGFCYIRPRYNEVPLYFF